MTRSLWRDPILDDMDPISIRILPYLPSENAEKQCETTNIVLSKASLKNIFGAAHHYGPICLISAIKEKMDAKIRDEVEVEILNPPEEIVINLVDGTINIDEIHATVTPLCNRETIVKLIMDLFAHYVIRDENLSPEAIIKKRRQLKQIHAIFTDEKIKVRRLSAVHGELIHTAKMFLSILDVRSAEFPNRFKQELMRAIDGNATSLLWLKVLKARSLSKEPIYAMELK